MFYDLHIHSCLSPCAESEMTIHNILNMCMLKQLDLISITDHNSMKQYRYLKEVVKDYSLTLLFGAEVQTLEDIHVCCYFKEEEDMDAFQLLLELWNPRIKNKSNYFGTQLLLDEQDQVYQEEEWLLLVSLNVTLDELCAQVHHHHGALVLAHAIKRSNSICTQLGFIPKYLKFDGIEIRNDAEKAMIQSMHPWITDTVWLINSDAHRLVEIHDTTHALTSTEFQKLWRNAI